MAQWERIHLQCRKHRRLGFDQDLGLILGREDPLEESMAIHCSVLAWRIPWTEELGGL